MKGKIISINTREPVFFRQLLDLMKSFPPIKGLRNKELDVLAAIMEENSKLTSLDKEERRDVIFSRRGRTSIQVKLNMADYIFNNNLTMLRKAKVLTEDNILADFLDISPDKSFTFSVRFLMKKK